MAKDLIISSKPMEELARIEKAPIKPDFQEMPNEGLTQGESTSFISGRLWLARNSNAIKFQPEQGASDSKLKDSVKTTIELYRDKNPGQPIHLSGAKALIEMAKEYCKEHKIPVVGAEAKANPAAKL